MNLNESQKNPIDAAAQRRFKGGKGEPAVGKRQGAKPDIVRGLARVISLIYTKFVYIIQ